MLNRWARANFVPYRAMAKVLLVAMVVGFVVPATADATVSVVTPEMITISPDQGPLTGGELLTITGTALNSVLGDTGYEFSVYFGGSQGFGGVPARIQTKSATEITVIVPRGIAVGPADITLLAPSVRVTREAGYRYLQPAISSVTPASGATVGGRQITITGLGFGFARGHAIGNSVVSSVRVGGNPATGVTRVSPTTITATVPPGVAGPATVEVTVTTGTGSPIVITAPGAYSYVVSPALPAITSVSPANGPTGGGNNVVVTGSNLRGSNLQPAAISFGGAAATFVSMSDDNTQATVVAPPGAVGPVNVVGVTSDGRATLTNGYTYGAAPIISAITPSSGPLLGGTGIVIDGSNFGSTGTPTVIVGGTKAVCVERVSESRITAVVPEGTLGAADVLVALETGGGSVTSTGGFTYATSTNNPTLTTVAPGRGPAAGGTRITLTGTNFTSASTPTVLINGECAKEVTVVSDTEMTAVTPPGESGPASVQITTSTGSVLETGKFSFVSITAVTPANGPTTGDTQITISGSGFGNTAPTVTVGALAATVVSYSDTSIVASTPPGSVGPRDVVVTPSQDGFPALSRSAGFRYDNPTVTSVFSSSGVLEGGMTVTVLGTGFGSSGTPVVMFGSRAATNVVRSTSTSLTAVVPAGAAIGPVTVTVTPAVGTGSGSLAAGFTYVNTVRTPLISSMSPRRGPSTG